MGLLYRDQIPAVELIDGETLTGIVVDPDYAFDVDHTVADIETHEVTGGDYERPTSTATVLLVGDGSQAAWVHFVSDMTDVDLTGIDRGGIAWILGSNPVDYSPDPGGPVNPYHPVWPDGVAQYPVTPITDRITALEEAAAATWSDWSDPMLAPFMSVGWITTEALSVTGLRWRKRSDGLVHLNGYGVYATGDAPPDATEPPPTESSGLAEVLPEIPGDIFPAAGGAIVPAYSANAFGGTSAAVAQISILSDGDDGYQMLVLMGDALHDQIVVDGLYFANP